MGYLRPPFSSQLAWLSLSPMGFLICLLFIKNSFGNNPENHPKLSFLPQGMKRLQEETGRVRDLQAGDDPQVATEA